MGRKNGVFFIGSEVELMLFLGEKDPTAALNKTLCHFSAAKWTFHV